MFLPQEEQREWLHNSKHLLCDHRTFPPETQMQGQGNIRHANTAAAASLVLCLHKRRSGTNTDCRSPAFFKQSEPITQSLWSKSILEAWEESGLPLWPLGKHNVAIYNKKEGNY